MAKEIAVLVTPTGASGAFFEPGSIKVFRKNGNKGWRVTSETELVLDKKDGLAKLRQDMAKVVEFLGNCKVFVGSTVVGVPYFVLEQAGVSIWEYEGKPFEFLDEILANEEDLARAEAEETGNCPIPEPVEVESGKYFVSLKEVQENNSGVTSKQVLQPFLRQAAFYELEVLCTHMPPWLEAELMGTKFAAEVQKVSNNETKVIITKRTCQC